MQHQVSGEEDLNKRASIQIRLAESYAQAGRGSEARELLQPLCQQLDEANSAFLPAHTQLADLQVVRHFLMESLQAG